jgi:putative CocE/NonD family hydrolase
MISGSAHSAHINLPALHVAGWFDYFTVGGLDAYTGMHREGATEMTRRSQRLLVGPWNHNSSQIRPDADGSGGAFVDYGPESPTMRFFAHHLKGEIPGYGEEPPVRVYVMGENVWRDEREWPLARTEWTPFFLQAGGLLSTQPPVDGDPEHFVYDPRDPVPGPLTLGATYNDAADLNALAARPDVLVYESPPLGTELEITGPVSVQLWASTTVLSTDFTARLVEVFPDGSATQLCLGIVRTAGEGGRLPGAAYLYEMRLSPTSVVLKPGHKVRLDISSSEYPTFELNPNTGRRITDDAEMVVATQGIFHDALHPSRVLLPVIPHR